MFGMHQVLTTLGARAKVRPSVFFRFETTHMGWYWLHASAQAAAKLANGPAKRADH